VIPVDVFVIPVGPDRYELYCEAPDAAVDPEAHPETLIGRIRHRFALMLHAAEERRQRGYTAGPPPSTWLGRVQERILAWVAERIAEQRLLWNLRRESIAVLAHPEDMGFEQVLTLVRRMLQRDHDRHRLWLVLDTILLIASAVLALVPGPNLVAYYFAFRVWGHWLSMRGAAQGLHGIAWTGRPSPLLRELRDLAPLDPNERQARVHDIAARLRLQHLSSFFERVAVHHA
jgi:hypothetical protein